MITVETGWRGPEADEVLAMAVGGTVLSAVVDQGGDVVIATDKGTLMLYHIQDCCESVVLEDVAGGELADLVGQVIVEAREDASSMYEPEPEDVDSYTWTFYTIRTNRTTLTLRFLGESSGYYSESMDVRWKGVA